MKHFLILWLILITLSWYPASAARLFVRTSTNFAEISSAIVSGPPFTFAAWVYRVSTNTDQGIIQLYTSGSGDNAQVILVGGDNLLSCASRTTTWAESKTGTAFPQNQWVHVACVHASATSRTAYQNGTATTTNTTSAVPSGMNRTAIGRELNGGNTWDGRIDVPVIWNVALTQQDITALAGGVHPRKIRPDAQVACPSLLGIGSPEPDLCAANSWTLNGTDPAVTFGAPFSKFLR